MKAALLFVGILVLGIVTFFGVYIQYSNSATRFETNIGKYNEDSKNVLSSYTMKVKEMAQVPDKYKKDLQDIIKQTFEGRYGADGSKAVFSFIQEQNLALDSSLYKNLQVVMEAGRNEFKLSQTRKLDTCAGYENLRNYAVSGFFVQMAGFPKKNIDTLCRIVVDSSTSSKFESGVDEVIKI